MGSSSERMCYVSNLHDKVTQSLLEELFTQVGPLEKVILNESGHRYALVLFRDEESVIFATECLDKVALFDKQITVRPKSGSEQAKKYADMIAQRQKERSTDEVVPVQWPPVPIPGVFVNMPPVFDHLKSAANGRLLGGSPSLGMDRPYAPVSRFHAQDSHPYHNSPSSHGHRDNRSSSGHNRGEGSQGVSLHRSGSSNDIYHDRDRDRHRHEPRDSFVGGDHDRRARSDDKLRSLPSGSIAVPPTAPNVTVGGGVFQASALGAIFSSLAGYGQQLLPTLPLQFAARAPFPMGPLTNRAPPGPMRNHPRHTRF